MTKSKTNSTKCWLGCGRIGTLQYTATEKVSYSSHFKNGLTVSTEREGFPGGASGKEPICQFRRHKRHGFNPWVVKIPWRRAWQPTPIFLPGKSHGQRSQVGYSLECHEELDMTEET